MFKCRIKYLKDLNKLLLTMSLSVVMLFLWTLDYLVRSFLNFSVPNSGSSPLASLTPALLLSAEDIKSNLSVVDIHLFYSAFSCSVHVSASHLWIVDSISYTIFLLAVYSELNSPVSSFLLNVTYCKNVSSWKSSTLIVGCQTQYHISDSLFSELCPKQELQRKAPNMVQRTELRTSSWFWRTEWRSVRGTNLRSLNSFRKSSLSSSPLTSPKWSRSNKVCLMEPLNGRPRSASQV